MNHGELFQLTPAAAGLGEVPLLVEALYSPLDAGQAGMLVSRHLVDSLQHERIASFDADQLINYRQHRPQMVFENWRFTDYDEPEIALDLLRDDEGRPVLLLHGPEPDLLWNRFTEAVLELIERFGVARTFSLQGVPMGTPHTRPVPVHLHGTDPELLQGQADVFGTLAVPGHVAGLIELRLGQAGRTAIGVTAAVPHYLAQAIHPAAAAALVKRLSELTGLSLPVGELEAAAARMSLEIDSQVGAQPEVSALVQALETQYDSYVRSQPQVLGRPPEPEEIPSAEEIGAAAEAFLADLLGRAEETGSSD